MLAFLLSKVGLKLLGAGAAVLGIAAALWFAYAWAYGRGVASVTPKLIAAQTTAQAARAANITSEQAITQLQAANALCAAAAEVSAPQTAAATQTVDQSAQSAESRITAAQETVRTVTRESPSAEQWAKQEVPHALADLLRK